MPTETEWRDRVLTELKRLDGNFIALSGEIKKLISEDLTKLKVKIAVLEISMKRDAKLSGLIGGAIPVAAGIAVYFFRKSG